MLARDLRRDGVSVELATLYLEEGLAFLDGVARERVERGQGPLDRGPGHRDRG